MRPLPKVQNQLHMQLRPTTNTVIPAAAVRTMKPMSTARPCSCGEDHEPCDGGLADELAMTIFSLCERIQNEKDPENVLILMNAVKEGTESLEILCKL